LEQALVVGFPVVRSNDLRVWEQEGFGPKGVAIWIVPVALLVCVYALWVVGSALSPPFARGADFAIAVLGLFIFSVIIYDASVLIFYGLKTARRISARNRRVSVVLFFGRSFSFSVVDVRKIRSRRFQLDPVISAICVLKKRSKNYKVYLKSGEFFFISSGTPGVEDLIAFLLSGEIPSE
jgi:uncharacterized protein YhhL (DUF1145 family)